MSAPRPLPLTQEETVAALRKAGVFAALPDRELEAVAEASRAYRYRAGEAVFTVGESGNALFVVERGSVSVVAGDKATDQTLATYGEGDAFGELELVGSAPRNASAFAEGETALIRFPRRGLGFESFLERSPDASALVLREFLRVVAARIRSANALVKENSPWVQELRRQAYADKLTGLYNKAFLEERMAELCAAAAPPAALLMFKPDNFKEINDTHGHEAGDEVLKIAAEALRRAYGEEKPTARYLGNEMAVVLPGADRTAAAEEARRVISLLGALDLSAATGGSAIRLSVSVGAALFPDHGASGAEVIAAAHELPLIGRGRGGNLVLFPEDR
jgi:diguanylate cyclase (GGDEF)-like protein